MTVIRDNRTLGRRKFSKTPFRVQEISENLLWPAVDALWQGDFRSAPVMSKFARYREDAGCGAKASIRGESDEYFDEKRLKRVATVCLALSEQRNLVPPENGAIIHRYEFESDSPFRVDVLRVTIDPRGKKEQIRSFQPQDIPRVVQALGMLGVPQSVLTNGATHL